MTTKQKILLARVTEAIKESIYEPYERGVYLYGGTLKTARSMPGLIAIVNLSEDSIDLYAFRKHNPLTCTCTDETFVSKKWLMFCDGCGGLKTEIEI